MKLYYMAGACSLATQICLYEAGAKFESTGLDRKNRTFSDGSPIDKINPKGYVPVLKLDDGQLLTENVAILLYVADHFPAAKLAPPVGTSLERYRLIEWLAFINSEVHKGFSPLFHPEGSDDLKRYALGNLNKRLGWLNTTLGARKFLAAEHFTVADAYLFTILGWAGYVKLDLGQWPNLKRYHGELATRPAVVSALKAEGLIK
jgi:glutathione S-transferase